MPDGSHTHGPSGSGLGFADNLASAVVLALVSCAGAVVVMWAFHILLLVAMCLGLTVMGAGAGYLAVRVRGRRRGLPPRLPGYITGQRPPRPGLDAPAVHLHLPPGTDPADAAALAEYLAERQRHTPAAPRRRALPPWGGGW